MSQVEKDRCAQVNRDKLLDQRPFETAWEAFRNTKIDLTEDSDDEQCRCLRNAIAAYLQVLASQH